MTVVYSNSGAAAENVRITVETTTLFHSVPPPCIAIGGTAVCDVGTVAGPQRSFHLELVTPDISDYKINIKVSISAEGDQKPENNVWIGEMRTYRTFFVANTADSGAGSLRAAIEASNAACTDTSLCLIAFRIPGDAAWHTIKPRVPLPAITGKNVWVDGSTQGKYHGDRNPLGPEIEINGAESTANGLELAGCTMTVSHLAINGFPGNGLLVTGDASCFRQVSRNYIGCDPTGTKAVPNQRGIWIRTATFPSGYQTRIEENVIGGNELSGVFIETGQHLVARNIIGLTPDLKGPLSNGMSGVAILPGASGTDVEENYIGFNGHVGVAIGRGAENVALRGNSLQANGALAIDYGIDDVTPVGGLVDIPEITHVRYADGVTRIEVQTRGDLGYFPRVYVYANDAPDPSGFGEGQYFLGEAKGSSTGYVFEYQGDLRGKWVTATATRAVCYCFLFTNTQGFVASTSEFSRAVEVR